MINLDYLLSFVTAAEKGSFSAAARHIGKSQSTISVSVNNLELDLGVSLFDRSGKYPVLTEEGEHLYQQAKVLIRQADRIENYTSSVRNNVENTLRFGLDPLVPFQLIESALEKLAEKFPFVQVEIVKESGDVLCEELKEDRLDFVLQVISQAVPEYFEFANIFELEWVCICSPDSEFADVEIVKNDMLTTERQILCKSMYNHSILGPIGTMSQSTWLSHDQDDMIRMVEQGIGWAFVPRLMFEERVSLGTLVEFVPEFQKTNPKYTADLLWKANSSTGPASQYLRELLFG
ncbi:LysR family transcriptional regulator [Vibrio amylolyticus]|uniref:LysR family transcriptional regulator n=1 Tax=Vibrio amylolyticus TaxID=2847292 RepID=UPI00354B2FCF